VVERAEGGGGEGCGGVSERISGLVCTSMGGLSDDLTSMQRGVQAGSL